MPLTKSKMPTEEARKIKKNLVALKKDIDAKYLTDHFIQEEIFDLEDSYYINGFNPNTPASRNDAFFQLLFSSGPNAYSVFLKALKQNGQHHLAKLIEETVLPGDAGDIGEDADWITSISEAVRTRRLEDKDLGRLSQTLDAGWEHVMFDLELTKEDVENAKQEQQTAAVQIYNCLNKWKTQKVNKATLDKFVKACQDSCAATVNWEKMKSIAQEMK